MNIKTGTPPIKSMKTTPAIYYCYAFLTFHEPQPKNKEKYRYRLQQKQGAKIEQKEATRRTNESFKKEDMKQKMMETPKGLRY